jgi:hypothetical protein
VAYFHLSILYKWKGDNEKSDKYWNKIRKELRDATEKEENNGLILPSSIDKIIPYETIFNHNFHRPELERIGDRRTLLSEERYIISFRNDPDTCYFDIALLYKYRALQSKKWGFKKNYREEIKISNMYFDMISNDKRELAELDMSIKTKRIENRIK